MATGVPQIFDPKAIDRHRRRALARLGDGADFLLAMAAREVGERLAAVKRRFPLAVELGSPLPLVVDQLTRTGQVDRVIRLDRLTEARPNVVADPEMLPLAAGSIDLIVSVLWLQWANDLPGVFAQVRRALKPDGLFLAVLAGGDTLTELRQAMAAAEAETTGGAAPRIVPFAEIRTVGALLQRAGFALPVADQDRHAVRYDSVLGLMRDLRAMGATNALIERDRRPLRRSTLLRTAELYADRFADADGRLPATFDIIWLSGWAPHESQQQPLRPGSAKARLADALGAVERSAGETAG
jgi:SAM-dependent methyltransferase